MNIVFNKFPNIPKSPEVRYADGSYLWIGDNKYPVLDTTSGITGYAVLGYTNALISNAIKRQLDLYCHTDINAFTDPNRERLAKLLCRNAPQGIDKVYFSGTSGSESIEAALKMSYQVHNENGYKQKKITIARDQSFHGATLHALSASEIPIFEVFEPLMMGCNVHRITQHNKYVHMKPSESDLEYAERSATELELQILKLKPENVANFIGETSLGSLVGDVPAIAGYWERIQEICNKYDVHMILDEVYCGLGRSGEYHCINNFRATPDFICVGKNLSAGFGSLSAVLTKREFEDSIAKGSGRLKLGHTYQGHSISVAAALEAQTLINNTEMLSRIRKNGRVMMERISRGLAGNNAYANTRGHGLMFSVQHSANNNDAFGRALKAHCLDEHHIWLDSKWHRTSFTPAYNLDTEDYIRIADCFIDSFKHVSNDQNK